MKNSVTPNGREHWDSRTVFVLAAIGSAIGLGNVWRFPRICAENGGFAFLIAFIVALFTAGIPILILELAMGKRTQKSTPGAFRFVGSKFEWLGWCIVGVGFLITCYYAVIMSWCWNYTVYSFNQAWGDNPSAFFSKEFLHLANASDLPQSLGGIFSGWGSLSVKILIGSVLTWLAIAACIWKGVKTVSKVIYATVLVPWVILLVFVVRGVTLPGASEGLAYYMSPRGEFLTFLMRPSTWIAAYTQVFFSISVGFGIMFAYGSFLKKGTNIVRNAFIIAISDALTAIIAGLAVFGCLGYLANLPEGATPISAWMDSSLGIAFVAYPQLINLIPGGMIFGPLFFIMLLMLAVDSAFSLVEGCTAAFEDKYGWSHHRAMLLICGFGFILGIPFMFQTGLYWFDTLDHFMNHFGLMFACIVECLVFGYVYRSGRIRRDLLDHHDNKLGPWFDYLVRYVSPVVLVGLLVWEIVDRAKGSYEGYGRTTEFYGGWLMLIFIGVGALVFTLLKRRKSEAV